MVDRLGTDFGLTLIVGVSVFLAIVAGFVIAPHVMVAVTIPFFLVLASLKVFVTPLLGGTKDLITLAAIAAATIVAVQRRATRSAAPADTTVLVLAALSFGLYIVNIGGGLSATTGHDIAWFHGVRLFSEPVALLMVGFSLRDPRRCLRWASTSLVVTGVGIAGFGLVQQMLGWQGLIGLGYTYGNEVRTIGPHLRSFGTLPEPFSYASVLLMVLAILLLSSRRLSPLAVGAIGIVAAGLAVSFVRTAAVISAALLGLAIARRGRGREAVLLVSAAVVAAVALFASAAGAPSTRSVRVSPTQYLTINGRTSEWRRALGNAPSGWIFGRGVGAEGTASQRATEALAAVRATQEQSKGGTVVDSGYLVAVADVGFIGLALILALLGRLLALGRRAASAGDRGGWVALGVLTVMSIDALTRESFTAFPTAYVGMLIVGLACAASSDHWTQPSRRHPPLGRAAPPA